MDDQLRISKQGVSINPSSSSSATTSAGGLFLYDHLYTTRQEFQKSVYFADIAPLVRAAAQGESATVVCGGAMCCKLNAYLFASSSAPIAAAPSSSAISSTVNGLVVQAADHLLQSLVSETGERLGKVTFSWFKLDNSTNEVLTDILKAASLAAAATGGAKTPQHSDALVLREAGRGRGMVVPHVYEVELSQGRDIEQVVGRVLDIIPTIADQDQGLSHTVLQLTITNKFKVAEYNATHTLKSNSPSAINADNPGIGRMSFLLLSQLSPPPRPSQSSILPQYLWVEQLQLVMQWIESRRSSPPFHKSRLLLFLKDVLLRRQKSVFIHFLQATVENRAMNYEWFRVAALINRDNKLQRLKNGEKERSSTPGPRLPSQAAISNEVKANTLRRVNSQSKLQDLIQQQQTSFGTATSRSSSQKSISTVQSSRPSTPVGQFQSTAPIAPPSQMAAIPPVELALPPKSYYSQSKGEVSSSIEVQTDQYFNGNDLQRTSSEEYNEVKGPVYEYHEEETFPSNNQLEMAFPTASGTPEGKQVDTYYEDSYMDHSPQPRAVPEAAPVLQHLEMRSSSARSINGGAISRANSLSRQNSFSNPPQPQVFTFQQNNNTNGARRSSTPRGLPGPQTAQSVAGETTSYMEDMSHHENDAALSIALEASRSEAAALRVAYQYANERYGETKAAYDQLMAQLKEEGSMLSKRDRDRYKSAMKDLKDYEIYKDVMETAMVRLQSELETFAKENRELRSAKEVEERHILKQKSSADKYAKELVGTKRRLEELEERSQLLEKQNKQIMKERDVAVASLAQTQSTAMQKASQYQETAALKSREIDDLQKKLRVAEDKIRHLEAEKESIMGANAIEVASLRAAHGKALETLMGYQEENDQLRSKVMQRTDDDREDNYYDTNHDTDHYSSPVHDMHSEDEDTFDGRRTHNTALSSSLPPPPPPPLTNPVVNPSQHLTKRVEEIIALGPTKKRPQPSEPVKALPPSVSSIVEKNAASAKKLLQRTAPQPPAKQSQSRGVKH